MLALKPNCECCDRDLPGDSTEAFICSFECTFCATCADKLDGKCPNCGGTLQARPSREASLLQKYPASVDRVTRETPCFAP